MNKKPLIWLTKQVKRRIPGLAVLTASQMGYSLLMGIFRPESGRLYLQGAEQLTLDRSTRRLFAYVPQLPKGLDTVLGESGAGLSEGQAQRLAIARAVLGGAPVLLLDECTSALDADTEQKVLQRIRALPDRTCIAVTHRSAAIDLCDWRLEVLDGKIRTVKNEI